MVHFERNFRVKTACRNSTTAYTQRQKQNFLSFFCCRQWYPAASSAIILFSCLTTAAERPPGVAGLAVVPVCRETVTL